jgi:hypothetical protein
MLSNLFFIIVQITFFSCCCCSINAFEFNLRFINVDYHSARFEIVDDNKTTLNYVVSYDLNSIKQQEIDPKIIETVSATRTFRIQTNSDRLAQLQLNSTRLNLTDTTFSNDDSGENYNSEELRQIKHESWTDMHQFVIDTLDENRVYDVTFRITAKQAHLKIFNNKRKIDTNTTTSQSKSKQFRFNFKTTFNLEVAAKKACDQFKLNKMNKSINSMFAQCYQTDSECTKCNSNCYEIKSSDINSNKNNNNNKPVLCEPCPCDTLRSTGSCDYNLTEDTVTCKQCIKPYTGSLCSLCENDGVDFYRNEIGKCISCECNGNTWFENTDILIKNGNRRRKCQAITGKILHFFIIYLLSFSLFDLNLSF